MRETLVFWSPKMFTSRSMLLHIPVYDIMPMHGNGDKLFRGYAKLDIPLLLSIKKYRLDF